MSREEINARNRASYHRRNLNAVYGKPICTKKNQPKVDAILALYNEQKVPLRARAYFYRLTTLNLVDKTRKGYENVCKMLTRLRLRGKLPYEAVADSTNLYGTAQYPNIEYPIKKIMKNYRSNWNCYFPEYIEVFLEKDGLSHLVYQATNPFGVDLNASGGTTKVAQVHSFIERAKQYNKPSVILYLGDFDPSGIAIDKALKEQLSKQRAYTYLQSYDVIRIALTEQQTKTLPTNFEKIKKDDPNYPAYHAKYGDEIWELDAMPPDELQKVVSDALEKYRPMAEIKKLEEEDKKEAEKVREKFENT